mmetsp:Transcript_2926/g.5745  ORF Transcript_2926/g.5745 Transcript_2926/m.5745 type:complete len:95 (+) Transcript_2926:3-287(+)
MDLVIWDPQDTALGGAFEWLAVEQACRPRYVALHNTNLPDHAGWLRQRLGLQGWVEVASGAYMLGDRWAQGGALDALLMVRDWVVLARRDVVIV